jgi:hypothetical protein
MAYFLRFVKECTVPEAWAKLQVEHPQLLEGMPTPERKITWEEVETAQLPVIGARARMAFLSLPQSIIYR